MAYQERWEIWVCSLKRSRLRKKLKRRYKGYKAKCFQNLQPKDMRQLTQIAPQTEGLQKKKDLNSKSGRTLKQVHTKGI